MYHIRFIDTKVVVWTGTWEQFQLAFNGKLDEDNSKTFEIVRAGWNPTCPTYRL